MYTRSTQLLEDTPAPSGLGISSYPPARAVEGSALLGSLARRLTVGRPAIAWSLALLLVFNALICFATVAFPISAHEPTGVIGATGAVGLVVGCCVWLFATRISLLGFEIIAGAGALATSAVITRADTHGGMMLAAFAYPWIAIYSAHFFPRRAVTVIGLLISAGFAAGLLGSGLPHVEVYWVVVTVTIWSICILLGNLSESLRIQVATDPLTGLLNRSGFRTAALRERALADRTGSPLTLAVIDLDDFKQVNDRAGHAAGDQLLATVARQWRERMRPSDILARHGGDEFVLLLPCTGSGGAHAALERLGRLGDPVGWSVGVSEWRAGESIDEPLIRADERLYEAKRGRAAHADPLVGPG